MLFISQMGMVLLGQEYEYAYKMTSRSSRSSEWVWELP